MSFISHQKISCWRWKHHKKLHVEKKVFSARLHGTDITSSSNMEKSSYCCCCRSFGCFNTGERNFHLSTPHSRPCAQHHISPLLSSSREAQLQPLLDHSLLPGSRLATIVLHQLVTVKVMRSLRWVTLSGPNHPVFQEFQKSLELFDKEAPNSDAPQRSRGKEASRGPCSSSSPSSAGHE